MHVQVKIESHQLLKEFCSFLFLSTIFTVTRSSERKSNREIYLFILIKQQQLHQLLKLSNSFFSLFSFFLLLHRSVRGERESLVFLSFIHSFICSTLVETTCRERRVGGEGREQYRNARLKCGYL